VNGAVRRQTATQDVNGNRQRAMLRRLTAQQDDGQEEQMEQRLTRGGHEVIERREVYIAARVFWGFGR
jgi:hypothetical protein